MPKVQCGDHEETTSLQADFEKAKDIAPLATDLGGTMLIAAIRNQVLKEYRACACCDLLIRALPMVHLCLRATAS